MDSLAAARFARLGEGQFYSWCVQVSHIHSKTHNMEGPVVFFRVRT